MAILAAANRSLQTQLGIHSRSLLIMSCAKKRYRSSGPVKYISKDTHMRVGPNSSAIECLDKKEAGVMKSKAAKSGKCAQKIPKFGDNNEFQNNIFDAESMTKSDILEQAEELLEVKKATGLALELVNADFTNMSGLFLDEVSNYHGKNFSDRNEVIISKSKEEAKKVAIELLAARAFTEVELRKKLCSKKFPLDVVGSVIADIKCRGLLNDGLYAESFSRSRWLSSTWGPRRIKQALVQKGVSMADVDKATKQVFEDDDDQGSQYMMQHGMSKPSMDHLILQASKQWLRGADKPLENRRSRMVRWLQYRGFNWGVTSFILKKLESHYNAT